MSTVGNGPKLVIGFEMHKPGQDAATKDKGELNEGKRLISNVVKSHKNLIDVVVYDALACNSIWLTTVEISVLIQLSEQKTIIIRVYG
ncbi:hypothetical protein [Desulfosporosinus sp. FKB]|uniref:hypothetical protein n=1 Tax=Desulfosporosinus sp. FKB TaxID=1969835 RepID=UPI001FA85549|nr:hypothetical protein [Desulfosporosinus sp. FKB]